LTAQQRYVGIWRSGTDGYYLWAGVDWTAFNKKWDDLAKQNLRLVKIKTYVQNGKRLYTGVWRSGSDGYYLWAGVDWANLSNKADELAKQKLFLVDIETYQEGGKQLYIGVWRSGTGNFAIKTGQDWTTFNTEWTNQAKHNMRLATWKRMSKAANGSIPGFGFRAQTGITSGQGLNGEVLPKNGKNWPNSTCA
jgi:hypothetical protein